MASPPLQNLFSFLRGLAGGRPRSAGVFISYRRDDSAGYAGRLVDRLTAHFGTEHIFQDVEDIEAGADFVDAIERALDSCVALLAVIGPHWTQVTDAGGRRRLEDPRDFIRLEIATALRRDVRVVPVLVGGATMPAEDELPPDLRALTRRQASELSNTRWRQDVDALVASLERVPALAGAARRAHGSSRKEGARAATGGRGRSVRRWAVGGALAVAGIVALAVALAEMGDPYVPYDDDVLRGLNVRETVPDPASGPGPAMGGQERPDGAPGGGVAGAPATVAGTWQDANGFGYLIQQQGSAVTLVQMSMGVATASGEGSVAGRTVRFQYRSATDAGTGVLTLSPDGRVLQGSVTGALGVPQPLILYR